jgi:heme/copper-type cytochrome/quinol oxidase subunit 2
MTVDALLATIILVGFLVTIIMAIGSYFVYKLRDSRRPHLDEAPPEGESVFFQRIEAAELEPVRREGPST